MCSVRSEKRSRRRYLRRRPFTAAITRRDTNIVGDIPEPSNALRAFFSSEFAIVSLFLTQFAWLAARSRQYARRLHRVACVGVVGSSPHSVIGTINIPS